MEKLGSYLIPDVTMWQLLMLAGIIVVFIFIIVMYQAYAVRRHKYRVRQHHLHELDRLALDKKLKAAEKEVILELADKYAITDILAVATDKWVFEHCINAEQEDLWKLNEASRGDAQDIITNLRTKLGFARAHYGEILYSTKQMSVGQSITVEGKLDGEKFHLLSKVVSNDEATLTIVHPRQQGAYVAFEPGERFKVHFYREGDGEYFFHTRVKYVGEEKIKLVHDIALERNQVRSYVRTHTSVPVTFFTVPSPRYPDKDALPLRDEDALQGVICDISSGGAKIETSEEVGDATYLNLRFTLGSTFFENVTGELHKVMGTGKVRFLNIEFKTISDDERARITVFVNESKIWNKKGTH